MIVVMALALGVIGVRLATLQTVENKHVDALARAQLVFAKPLPAHRGAILDRNGEPLALSLPRTTVFADPTLVRRPTELANRLAPILGRPAAVLEAELRTPQSRYVPIAPQVGSGVVAAVRALGDPGIGFVDEDKRILPDRSLAGPVIGSVSDGRGAGGLEAAYDRVLSGRAGRLEEERDPSGRVIPAADQHETPARAGSDLVLTVDQSLQFQVEQHLVAEVGKVRAQHGMAVIADVRTGDILAMAQVDGPSGSRPAHPSSPSARNRLFTDPFEPGSTTKVITAASALETGAIDPTTRFDVPASIKIGDGVFVDDEPHATASWTVSDILQRSSNVGAIEIAHQVGRANLDRYMREFGFGAKTAVDFPGESRGILQAPTSVDPSIMGSMPIGYGIAVTTMQTLQVFATVANGGVSRPLRLVDATIDAAGRRHRRSTLPGRRIVSAQTAATLTTILQGVVANGTGKQAAVPGFDTAGKTGTARKPPYKPPLHYMASFAGFVPAESPRLVGIVVLDDPETEIHGGAVAAPVFSQIMQDGLRLTAGKVSAPAP